MIVIRAPFNEFAVLAEMLANKSLFNIWICQFYLVWVVVFCMIVRRIHTVVKEFRARKRRDTGEHPP